MVSIYKDLQAIFRQKRPHLLRQNHSIRKKKVSSTLWVTAHSELNAKIKAFEDQQQARDALNAELETKQSELTKLTEQKAKLDEEIKQKKQELTEPMQNKLDYFEAEVRRLEQKLTE